MFHTHTHNTNNTYPPPNLPLPALESTRFDSGGDRRKPWSILYPYRRHAMPKTKSSTFLRALSRVGGKEKKSGRSFAESKASSSSVPVVDTPKPLSSTDPTETVVGMAKELEKEAYVDTKANPALKVPLDEIVVARLSREPEPPIHDAHSTDPLPTPKAAGGKQVLKPGLGMIRNLLPIQLLRLRKKLKKEMDSGVFKLGESKPNVVEIELAPMGEERSPVEVNSFKSGVQQFREANPSTEAWSAANPCNIGCFCGAGSSRAKLGPTSVHEPPPTHSELMELFDIVEASYSALAAPEDLPTPPDDVIGDAFVLHSKIVRVSRPAGSHQDVQAKVGIANDRMNMAERQRENNRRDISSMASKAFELSPVKPLRLKSKRNGSTMVPDEVKSDSLTFNFVLARSRESEPASSPVSISPTTPTPPFLSQSILPPLDITDKLSRLVYFETSWAWNTIDEVDDDRDGAIGTTL